MITGVWLHSLTDTDLPGVSQLVSPSLHGPGTHPEAEEVQVFFLHLTLKKELLTLSELSK